MRSETGVVSNYHANPNAGRDAGADSNGNAVAQPRRYAQPDAA